jgi:hypothetical protein
MNKSRNSSRAPGPDIEQAKLSSTRTDFPKPRIRSARVSVSPRGFVCADRLSVDQRGLLAGWATRIGRQWGI